MNNHGRALHESSYFFLLNIFSRLELAAEFTEDSFEAFMENFDGIKSAGGGEDSG